MAWLKSARAASDCPMRSSSRPRALKDSALAWSNAMACPKSVSASRRLQGQASKHNLLSGVGCTGYGKRGLLRDSFWDAGVGTRVVRVLVGCNDLHGWVQQKSLPQSVSTSYMHTLLLGGGCGTQPLPQAAGTGRQALRLLSERGTCGKTAGANPSHNLLVGHSASCRLQGEGKPRVAACL